MIEKLLKEVNRLTNIGVRCGDKSSKKGKKETLNNLIKVPRRSPT